MSGPRIVLVVALGMGALIVIGLVKGSDVGAPIEISQSVPGANGQAGLHIPEVGHDTAWSAMSELDNTVAHGDTDGADMAENERAESPGNDAELLALLPGEQPEVAFGADRYDGHPLEKDPALQRELDALAATLKGPYDRNLASAESIGEATSLDGEPSPLIAERSRVLSPGSGQTGLAQGYSPRRAGGLSETFDIAPTEPPVQVARWQAQAEEREANFADRLSRQPQREQLKALRERRGVNN